MASTALPEHGPQLLPVSTDTRSAKDSTPLIAQNQPSPLAPIAQFIEDKGAQDGLVPVALTINRMPREFGEERQVEIAANQLQRKLKVEQLKKTNLIDLTYESANPEQASRVLNELANLYLAKHVAVHRPMGALEFFRQESERYRTDLVNAELHLQEFNRQSGIVSASLEKEAQLQKLTDFNVSLHQTQADIAEIGERARALETQMASIPARMVTQIRDTDDGLLLSQIKSNLLSLEQKRTELLTKFEPGYRLVREVDTQIDQARRALASADTSKLHEESTDRDPTHAWVAEELAKAKAELAGLKARERTTAATIQSYRGNLERLDEKQVQQDDLARTIRATEENYLLSLRKQEESRISDALDRGRILNVAIAEPATTPALPSNRRLRTIAFGILLAMFVSLASVAVSEYLDPTFRTPSEVESVLNIPVLAAMPRTGKRGVDA